jgi:hypothetical protein
MMYLYRLLKSIGLDVEVPVVLEIDNKGAVDMVNSSSSGGRTRHMDVRNYYMRELKEEGLLVVRHISGEDNDTDIFTKNTSVSTFLKHIPVNVGKTWMRWNRTIPKSQDGRVLEFKYSYLGIYVVYGYICI